MFALYRTFVPDGLENVCLNVYSFQSWEMGRVASTIVCSHIVPPLFEAYQVTFVLLGDVHPGVDRRRRHTLHEFDLPGHVIAAADASSGE